MGLITPLTHTPPPFDSDCSAVGLAGLSPQMTSPQSQMHYVIQANAHNLIPFTAVTDADVKVLYWFIGNTFLGQSLHDQPFMWQATPGHFIVRVVDDPGRSDVKNMDVILN